MIFRLLCIGTLTAAWLGCAGAVLGQAADQGSEEPEIRSLDNPVTETTDSVRYQSLEGDFEILFPRGCSKIKERTPSGGFAEDTGGLLKMTVNVFCDRRNYTGEGCAVTAYIDPDLVAGPPADPAFVLERVRAILESFGVRMLDQKPYRQVVENGPLIEGVDVLAADPENKGQVWVRGLLIEGDVYLLVAWRTEGQLAADPDYVAFFDSFRAHGMER